MGGCESDEKEKSDRTRRSANGNVENIGDLCIRWLKDLFNKVLIKGEMQRMEKEICGTKN